MTTEAFQPHPAYDHLVVPFDGSAQAEHAASVAARLATASGAALHVLHLQGGADGDGAQIAAEARSLAARLGATAEIRPASGGGMPAGMVIGDHLAELGNAAAVMATHGRGRLASAVFGSVTAEVVGLGHPVVAVGPEAALDVAPKRILACVDPSSFAQQVIGEAAGWARALQVPLWLIEVVSPKVLVTADGGQESSYVHRLAGEARAAGLDLEWEVLHHDRPAEAIVRYATEPGTMLALATHGRTGMQRALVGSVAADVLHAATCPVVLVRPGS
jgi:nucleotide-binding universal stress UspA family protein